MPPKKKRKVLAEEQPDGEQLDAVQKQAVAPQRPASQKSRKELYGRILRLPVEIQFMIWREASQLGGLKENTRLLCQLNCQTNAISYEQDIDKKDGSEKSFRIVPVYSNGMNHIFWFKILEEERLFRDFLEEIKDLVIFMFRSPDCIPRFFRVLGHLFEKPEDIPAIRVRLPLFSSRDLDHGAHLSRWKPRQMVHGYSNRAYEHVKGWMDAVQSIPSQVKVEVTMNRPWMDYRSLRGLSSQLGLHQRAVEVRINTPAWHQFPDSDFHIGLTVGALQGVTMARQSTISDNEAKILIDHGCRGFRG